MITIAALEKLDIFKTFTDDELGKILEICVTENYRINDRLFMEGDAAKEMWIVLDGKVELRFEMPNAAPSSSKNAMSSHDQASPQSQVFGWSCFIPPYKMRLSAYCASRRCQVLKLNADKLNQLFESQPEIGYKAMRYLVQVLGFRFKQMQEEVAKFIGINMMNSW